MTTRSRLAVCLFCGLLAGLVSHFWASTQSFPRDLETAWAAGRAVLRGQDPYSVVSGLFYPLPGVLAALPVALIPSVPAACAVFMFLSGTAYAWALTEYGPAPLIGFFAAGMRFATEVVQWSPLFAGAYAIAPLGLFFVLKPHVGLPIFVARPSRWPIVAGVICTLIAFAIDPNWVLHWRANMARFGARLGTAGSSTGYVYAAILFMPGGFLTLAALARWRRPEARLLVALACVPQSLILYELVPLALIPRGWVESLIFWILSYWVLWLLVAAKPWPNMVSMVIAGGQLSSLLIYAPLTYMVLCRPNVGNVPGWIERRVAGWPAWLRGAATGT